MAAQADHDWTRFLERRADELAPGGQLVVNLMAVPDGGRAAGKDIWEMTRAISVEMADEGLIDGKRLEAVRHPDLRADGRGASTAVPRRYR
jgi:SAM dependent carboxyl methyltransferase